MFSSAKFHPVRGYLMRVNLLRRFIGEKFGLLLVMMDFD